MRLVNRINHLMVVRIAAFLLAGKLRTMKKRLPNFASGLLGLLLGFGPGMAAEVPEILPRPDTTPPSEGKVKVYILAGQSNMVGFGYLKDSRPGWFVASRS